MKPSSTLTLLSHNPTLQLHHLVVKDTSLSVPALWLLMVDNEWVYLQPLPQPQPAQILPVYP